jgi:type II secretory pathway pseudopilin PulG
MEIIVSVMLVSMVVLGIAAGFLGLVRTNRMTQEQQAVDHAVTNYSESLKSAEYLPCSSGPDPDYDALSGLWVSERGVSVWVVDVQYWDESTGSYVDSCSGDTGSQRLTVRAEWRDRERQGQIVKRSR